jgi:tetratricopeptide (TPR) repeat protein
LYLCLWLATFYLFLFLTPVIHLFIMKSPQQLYEQLECYLNGSMRKKEREAFEEEIRTHRRLAEELASFQLLRRVLRQPQQEMVSPPQKSRLSKPAAKATPKPKASPDTLSFQASTPKPGIGRFILASLSIILLFALSIYAVNLLQPSPDQELFSAYFQVCASPDTNHAPLNTAPWAEIRQHFDAKNYAAAIPLLQEVCTRPGAEGLNAHYYLGVCYLAIEPAATRKAIEHLMAADVPQSTDQLEAEWYLGLAYLKNGETRRAGNLFKRMNQQTEFTNKTKLEELISDLK